MYIRQIALPQSEPIALTEAKTFCKVPANLTTDDSLITGLIQSAREYAEAVTARSLAQRQFVMVLDSHPYYTDTIQSQLAYPSSYYSLPRYSTTLWNYSQMIKVPYPPLKSVDSMQYIDSTGNPQTLNQDVNFVVDRTTEYARIFPIPGQFWPADLYVANSVQITFTAGFDPNPAASPDTHTISNSIQPPGQQPSSTVVLAVPQTIRTAILMLVNHWYMNREPVASGQVAQVPYHISWLLASQTVVDFAPGRG